MELAVQIVGFTQAFKLAGVPVKWLPLVAILMGGLLNGLPFILSPGQALAQAVAEGFVVGLVSTGLVGAAGDIAKKMKN